MATSSSVQESLAELGWHLSPDGLQKCQDGCKEKGWPGTTKNIVRIALDLDLRSIGVQSLPIHSMNGEVKGRMVLQIQKVKNVAVPSTKQHLPSPNRRLLRLQVTDGQEYISAVESDGAIDKLSPTTPPGTKIRLKGAVCVVNGFLLLTKSGGEVLGGQVESLLKKWSLNKGMSENLSRSRTGTTSGPPPFVPLKDSRGRRDRDTKQSSDRGKSKSSEPTRAEREQQEEGEKPARAQMEKPKERLQRKPDRKPETSMASRPPPRESVRSVQEDRPPAGARGRRRGRGGQREEDDDYQPQSRPKSDYQLADWFGKKLALDDKTSSDNRGTQDTQHREYQRAERPSQSTGSQYRRGQRDSEDRDKPRGRQAASVHHSRGRGGSVNGRYSQDRTSEHSSMQHSSQPPQRNYDDKSGERRSFHDKRDAQNGGRRERGGRQNRDLESTSQKKDFDSTSRRKDFDSTSRRKDFDSTSQRRDYDSTSRRKDFDSTSWRKDFDSTSQRRDYDSTSQRKDFNNTSQRRDLGSTSRKKDIDSTSQRKDFDSTSQRRELGSTSQSRDRNESTGTSQRRDYDSSSSKRERQQDFGRRESARKREEVPIITEAWADDDVGGNHWGWVGSSSSAVPFTAKRQN